MISVRLCVALTMLLSVPLGSTARAQDVVPAAPFVAPAEVARRDEAAFQRRQAQRNVQAELVRLRRDRPGLLLPIALTGLGVGVVGGGLALAAGGLALEWLGGGSRADLREEAKLYYPMYIASGVGALIGTAGALWIWRRVEMRRPYNERIQQLTTMRF